MADNYKLISLAGGALTVTAVWKNGDAGGAASLDNVRDQLLTMLNNSGMPVLMPIFMETKLSEKGVEQALEFMQARGEEEVELLRSAPTGLLVAFHKPNDPLMELH
jgi:hypothetical protein